MNRAADGLRVRWLGGAILAEQDGFGLLLDAPDGLAATLGDDVASVRAIAVTSGRISAIGGLLAVFDALAPHRVGSPPLPVRHPFDDERAGAVLEAWNRGWPNGIAIALDAHAPSDRTVLGPFTVTTRAIPSWEPDFAGNTVAPAPAVAMVVSGAWKFAWIPSAAPDPAIAGLCRGVSLAILGVGVRPWPPSPRPVRLGRDSAAHLAAVAAETWLVGDDGRLLSGPSD